MLQQKKEPANATKDHICCNEDRSQVLQLRPSATNKLIINIYFFFLKKKKQILTMSCHFNTKNLVKINVCFSQMKCSKCESPNNFTLG